MKLKLNLALIIALTCIFLSQPVLFAQTGDDNLERSALSRLDASMSSDTDKLLLEKFFAIALDSFKQKDYISSRKQFEAILSVYPGHALSKKYLVKTNAYINALKHKSKSGKKLNKSIAAAISYYEKSDYENARNSFNQILAQDPYNETAKTYIGKMDNSISSIAAAHVNELYTQALDLYVNGKYDDAIKYFEATTLAALKYFDAVILDNSQRLDTLDFINDCKQKIKEDQERVETLAKEKIRERVLSNYSRGEKFFTRGYYKAALNELEEGKKIASGYGFTEELAQIDKMVSETKNILADESYKLAEKHFEKGELEEAYDSYSLAAEYDPSNAKAKTARDKLKETLAQKNYEKGMELMMAEKSDKAREFFKKALTYQSDKKEVLRALERIK